MPSGWLGLAYTLTSAASSVTRLGFGVAKASTKLGVSGSVIHLYLCGLIYVQFSIARGIASVTPIPLLTTSLDHLESLSLLPILLGESIASTSLTAASTSLDVITNLLDGNDEASFSLSSFVTLVRGEWAEHGLVGRSVTEVARAVAAWAAIQGFTKQWSEERWLRNTTELAHLDFRPPENSIGEISRHQPLGRRRTISRVSVTDDVIMPGQLSQVISADIGEKGATGDVKPSATTISIGMPSSVSPARSNFETWKTLRRLSKMVLAGYGGAGLLFFGTPLRPDEPTPQPSKFPTFENNTSQTPFHTDSEVKDMEENILIHVVEDAEAEAISPTMHDVPVPEMRSQPGPSGIFRSRTDVINPIQERSGADPSSSYSWWNVLLGKHDREIFEGFAFTPVDDADKAANRFPLSPSSGTSSPSHSRFHSLASSQVDSLMKCPPNAMPEGSHQKEEPKKPTAIVGDMRHMPRFWVLTDHGRQQVVLVVRGE